MNEERSNERSDSSQCSQAFTDRTDGLANEWRLEQILHLLHTLRFFAPERDGFISIPVHIVDHIIEESDKAGGE
jgi:hypothetical protein